MRVKFGCTLISNSTKFYLVFEYNGECWHSHFFRGVQAAHFANPPCKVFSVLLPAKPFQYYVCLSDTFLITHPVSDTALCSSLCLDSNVFCAARFNVHFMTCKDESQEFQITSHSQFLGQPILRVPSFPVLRDHCSNF